MSKNNSIQLDNPDYVEEKVEKAHARRHQVRWSYVFILFLLFASVGISIYIIEFYQ
jgi:hypothetical protein